MDEGAYTNPASATKVAFEASQFQIRRHSSDSTTRGKWPMDIVDAVETDGDGLMQTAAVHTGGGKTKRDVRRLCLLEGG
ncbi:unnamed protein product, partial [Echinostoma caproni]|uniref:DUF5641 domain-containing protein n=1 Tax=Echinostoma caproni TaxID=27848 RepID=A0A183BG03_9TREM